MRKEAVYYRKTDIKKFEDFKDGDIICEVCNGWGYFYDCFDNKVSQCYHCQGIGKLDWITNVTGITGQSGTTGGASLAGSSFHDVMGTSGYGTFGPDGTDEPNGKRPIHPPPPPKKRVSGGKTLKQKSNKIFTHQFPTIETTPYKAAKKVSWKEKIMNAVF